MENELSDDLKERLEIIKKETDFFLITPPVKPHKFMVVIWAIILLISIILLDTQDHLSTLFLILLATFMTTQSHYESKFFEIHSRAREIIDHYRKKEAARIHDKPNAV